MFITIEARTDYAPEHTVLIVRLSEGSDYYISIPKEGDKYTLYLAFKRLSELFKDNNIP